ncbi:integrase, partial [Candidatus Bipolaricaulota bacterium]|nr:integrase [Candidatus Bipolaricaulota bacterium]
VVAELLEKLRVELTKSRARQTNDQALVEGKNGSIVRKQMGYGWIAPEEAEKIQAFYRKTLNVYLTPYEKLRSLPQAEQYLRPGVTMAELERIARGHSDTEYALLVQQEKAGLFRSFAPRGTAS